MPISIAQVRTLYPLESLQDSQIEPHLARAVADFSGVDFDSLMLRPGVSKEQVEIEAIGCKCIYYLAPLLWTAFHKKVNKSGEMLEGYKDIQAFQVYWRSRSDTALELDSEPENNTEYVGWASV